MPSSETASVIFDSPAIALAEDEGDLLDALAHQVGELGRLDLEGVAGGEHRVEVELGQRARAPQLEAAAEVVEGQAEDELRARAAHAAEHAAGLRPAGRAAAGHVAVAEHEVGLAGVEHREHLGELLRRVGEVRVHLADDAVAALQAPREARAVGHAEAVLAGAVQDVHPRALGGQRVGQLAGPVGRRVVDHEQLEAGRGEALDEAGEGLGLAVGRDDDDRAAAVARWAAAAGVGAAAGAAVARRARPSAASSATAIATSSPAKETRRRASASAVAGPAPIGGAEREDERALAQPEPAGGERDEDAEQPRQREGAEEQEGVEAGGRAERPRQRPGAEAGGDPARGVEGDHERQRAPAQRPGGLDPAGLEAVVEPAADEGRARGDGGRRARRRRARWPAPADGRPAPRKPAMAAAAPATTTASCS